MPELTATIPHQLSRSEARRRIQQELAVVRQQYGAVITNLQESWSGDTMTFSLTAMGQAVSGRVTVQDHAVHLAVTLPWLLHLLAHSLKPKIEQKGRVLLECKDKTPG